MSTSGSANYVLLTRLADEFAARYRAGERPSLQEYIDRHPELADDIHELFPAMVEMVNHYVRGTCRPALASAVPAVPARIRGQPRAKRNRMTARVNDDRRNFGATTSESIRR